MPRKGAQVNTDTRRVYLFIAVGLMAAGVIGYGVWRAGAPTTPSASDIATATPEVSTLSESAPVALITPTSEPEEVSLEAAPQAPAPPLPDDPFLAPHAIVQAVPSTIAPTTVYRPENIRPVAPTSDTPAEPTELMTQPAETPETPETPDSTAPTEPTDVEETPPTETPVLPGEPGLTPGTPETPEPTLPALSPEPTPESGAASATTEPEPTTPMGPTATEDGDAPAAPSPAEAPAPAPEPEIEQAAVTTAQPSQHVSAGLPPARSS